MQYFGGKHRLAADLVRQFAPNSCYVEPFVGGASVLCLVSGMCRYASDANHALIAMWVALQSGWLPPESVSEAEYEAAKGYSDDDPRKAFIGFGTSFSGKWFGGYARGAKGRNYASNARNGLLKKAKRIRDVKFTACDYRKADYPVGCLVYCDPPYAGTTQYGAVDAFDWNEFWAFYADLSISGRRVYVSEYAAPDERWTPCFIKEVRTDIRTRANGKEARIEKLFTYKM